MYRCKNGTNAKIKKLLIKAEKATASEHEHGTAFQEFNDALWDIIDNKQGTYLENCYRTS